MSDGKRYYWLRLKDDFFSSKRIKKLRNMAGGDTYCIIYLKLQLLAMKSEGVLTWTGLEENFAEELALDLDEKSEDVEVTLLYLLKVGLAETQDNTHFFFPYAVENTGSEGASAQRVREYRERQTLQCNADVTPVKRISNGEKEIERRDREKSKNLTVSKETVCATDVTRVIEAWNSLNLARIVKITQDSQRWQWLSKRLKDYGLDNVLIAIENVRASDFLMGKNKKGWQATFDWFIKPNNFPKVLDGNYDNKKRPDTNNIFLQILESET